MLLRAGLPRCRQPAGTGAAPGLGAAGFLTLVNRAELAARPVPEGLLHWSQRQSEPAFGAVGATGNSMNTNQNTNNTNQNTNQNTN